MPFLIWVDRSEKEKKNSKHKIEKIISEEPENNKEWLQSQHGGNGGRKNRHRC